MNELVPYLPHWNASLNSLATLLLVAGWVLIKRRQETAHKLAMFSAFGVSIVFLASYLIYHWHVGHRPFPTTHAGPIRVLYYVILFSHLILAMSVPVLSVGTIWYGVRNHRPRHRAWARWAFPIWLYVSITGVVVYFMLYHL